MKTFDPFFFRNRMIQTKYAEIHQFCF